MYSNNNSYPSTLGGSPMRRSHANANASPVGSPLKQPRSGACPDYKDPSTLGKANSVGTPVEII